MLCAGGEKNKDSCQGCLTKLNIWIISKVQQCILYWYELISGDSGGPLMSKDKDTPYYYIIGVVSFGVGCGYEGSPGVYARVDHYINWILAHMKP